MDNWRSISTLEMLFIWWVNWSILGPGVYLEDPWIGLGSCTFMSIISRLCKTLLLQQMLCILISFEASAFFWEWEYLSWPFYLSFHPISFKRSKYLWCWPLWCFLCLWPQLLMLGWEKEKITKEEKPPLNMISDNFFLSAIHISAKVFKLMLFGVYVKIMSKRSNALQVTWSNFVADPLDKMTAMDMKMRDFISSH